MLNEGIRYLVEFSHDNENATDESIRHGRGKTNITVDHEITNQADLDEIARAIGREYGFTKLVINRILNADGTVLVDSNGFVQLVGEADDDDVQSITSLDRP